MFLRIIHIKKAIVRTTVYGGLRAAALAVWGEDREIKVYKIISFRFGNRRITETIFMT